MGSVQITVNNRPNIYYKNQTADEIITFCIQNSTTTAYSM